MKSSRGMTQDERRRLAIGAGATVGATLLMGGTAQAAVNITVDSLADPTDLGHTTLHDALATAETPANLGGTITFASGLSGSINLTTDLHSINYATKIVGPGAGQLAISGQNARGILRVSGLAPPGLQISGLTLRNGNNTANVKGGAMNIGGGSPVTLSDMVLADNTAPQGGAIYDVNGTLDIQRSTFTGNTSTGISSGGAIQAYGTSVTISDSLISANNGVTGGGIEALTVPIPGGRGSLALQRSTVSGNTASQCCGGIYANETQTTTLRASTISGNRVPIGPSGGMYVNGPLSLIGSTIAGNSSSDPGGGVYGAVSFQPTIQDTIIAGNNAPTGPDLTNAAQVAFSLIGNPAGSTINATVAGSNLTGVDPQLLPLAANGGPTPTMALAATSPAIDTGANFGLSTDQRGLARPLNVPTVSNSAAAGADASDIGAFEYQPPKCKKKKKHKHKRAADAKKHKKKSCKKKKKKRK